MSYIALYRKWRPLVFEDVVEQEHVVKTLRNSISTGRIAHAYLFCGTRGTGKTTMAKIFSRAINCLNPNNGDPCNECEICREIISGSLLDVIEIDAASNNSVDNIREIRDEVIYTPSQARYKVYIIDEVHMLSTGAFNALLKTLEEPPQHVVFILATTEPHKLPATILSRCQRFDFRRISIESIVERLNKIAQAGSVILQYDAARLIAKMSDGALRDAISILDQCVSLGTKEITYSDVLAVVGIVNDTFIANMIDAVIEKNTIKILELIETLVLEGKDIAQFVSDLVMYYRNLLICKVTDKPGEIIDVSKEVLDRMSKQCVNLDQGIIMLVVKELSALESGLKWATHPRILLELTLIKICEYNFNTDANSLMERLALLESKIQSGNFIQNVLETPKSLNVPEPVNVHVTKPESKKVNDEGKKASIQSARELKPLDGWNEIVDEFRKMGRMVLYSNLLDAKVVELDNRFVGIVLGEGSGFCKIVVSKPENLEVIESVISKKLGRDIKVKCVDEDEAVKGSKDDKKEENDPLVEKAKDIANRLNIPFNIIDD